MFGEDQIAKQLADTRAALAQAATTSQPEPIVAEAAEGRIKVALGTDGRIEGIKMGARALRDGPEAFVEQLKLALNDALDQRAAMVGTEGPAPDMGAVNEQVADIQDSSLRQFQAMSASISEVMGKLHGGR